jgi:hypothetical protein
MTDYYKSAKSAKSTKPKKLTNRGGANCKINKPLGLLMKESYKMGEPMHPENLENGNYYYFTIWRRRSPVLGQLLNMNSAVARYPTVTIRNYFNLNWEERESIVDGCMIEGIHEAIPLD